MPNEQHKKLSIDTIVGQIIKKVEFSKDFCLLTMKDGSKYNIDLQDDGSGTGNDSYAFFGEIDLGQIINRKIVAAKEDSDSYGGILTIETRAWGSETKNPKGTIQIIHSHNGYYGWGYELFKSNP